MIFFEKLEFSYFVERNIYGNIPNELLILLQYEINGILFQITIYVTIYERLFIFLKYTKIIRIIKSK
jgi:hypothetical protein